MSVFSKAPSNFWSFTRNDGAWVRLSTSSPLPHDVWELLKGVVDIMEPNQPDEPCMAPLPFFALGLAKALAESEARP